MVRYVCMCVYSYKTLIRNYVRVRVYVCTQYDYKVEPCGRNREDTSETFFPARLSRVKDHIIIIIIILRDFFFFFLRSRTTSAYRVLYAASVYAFARCGIYKFPFIIYFLRDILSSRTRITYTFRTRYRTHCTGSRPKTAAVCFCPRGRRAYPWDRSIIFE